MNKQFKIEQLVRCSKPYWRDQRQLVRIAKRRRAGFSYEYFVTHPKHPKGYGTWVSESALSPLTPLEMLALAAED